MKFEPKDLEWKKAYDLFTDIAIPRPIAWVSTVGSDGIYNVAPYSYFTPICNYPMIIGFSLGRKQKGLKKDTLVNIESTKEFVINVVTEALAESMNKTAVAYPPHIDEFEKTNLTPVKADIVKAPMVGESPVSMECKLMQILEFGVEPKYNNFVIGEVVKIHIKEEFMVGDQIQSLKLKIIGRLGAKENSYCRTTDLFRIKKP